MAHIQNTKKLTIGSSFFFTSLIKAASFLKVSFILGSWAAFFSATSIVVPLVGAFTGISGSIVIFGLSMIVRYVISGSLPFIFLAYHIPGLCASAYFASSCAIIRLFLPLVCMAAFILHPVGAQAWVYSLYWLIPVALYFMRKESLFLTSLGSTFTAHAVGSVIWIYANPMTPQAWLVLIPVVFVERLVFASGMVIAYHAIKTAQGINYHAAITTIRRKLIA